MLQVACLHETPFKVLEGPYQDDSHHFVFFILVKEDIKNIVKLQALQNLDPPLIFTILMRKEINGYICLYLKILLRCLCYMYTYIYIT